MITVAFINQKGGSCKTTALLALGKSCASAGWNVAVRDMDIQGSARRGVEFCEGLKMEKKGDEPELLLVDTPGNLKDRSILNAIMAADRVIVPTSPSPMDLDSTRTATLYVDECRREVPKALLFCRVSSGKISKPESLNQFAADLKWPRLQKTIPESEVLKRIGHEKIRLPRDLSAIAAEILELKATK